MSPIQWKLVHTRQTGFQPHVYFIFDKIVDICSNILESKIKGLLNRKNLVGIKTWQAAFDWFCFSFGFPCKWISDMGSSWCSWWHCQCMSCWFLGIVGEYLFFGFTDFLQSETILGIISAKFWEKKLLIWSIVCWVKYKFVVPDTFLL